MQVQVTLQGAEWIDHLGETYQEGIEAGLEEFARALEPVIVERTPTDYVTDEGKAKSFEEHIINQWEIEIQKGTLVATIFNPSEYGPDLEEGLYPNVGPRTIDTAGGIFSRQAPGGIIGPILKDERLIEDLLTSFERNLDQSFDKVLERS